MAGTEYRGSEIKDVDQFLSDAPGLDSEREKEIGQHIGYRYDVNLTPDYDRITPFLTKYIDCLLYTSPSPRDGLLYRMPSSA